MKYTYILDYKNCDSIGVEKVKLRTPACKKAGKPFVIMDEAHTFFRTPMADLVKLSTFK